MKSKWQNILFECGKRESEHAHPTLLSSLVPSPISAQWPSLDPSSDSALPAPRILRRAWMSGEKVNFSYPSLGGRASIQDSSEHLFLVDFITG